MTIIRKYILLLQRLRMNETILKKNDVPKKCCQELIRNWLITYNVAKADSKVWSTLLDILKKLYEMSANITEDINTRVI